MTESKNVKQQSPNKTEDIESSKYASPGATLQNRGEAVQKLEIKEKIKQINDDSSENNEVYDQTVQNRGNQQIKLNLQNIHRGLKEEEKQVDNNAMSETSMFNASNRNMEALEGFRSDMSRVEVSDSIEE